MEDETTSSGDVAVPPSTARTALVMHNHCALHDTGWNHPEHQGRLPAIVNAIYRDTPVLLDRLLQHEAAHATEAQLLRVHTSDHVAHIRALGERARSSGELVQVESDTVMSGASRDAALAAAGAAVDGVRLVMEGRAESAMALGRPPGHHATPDRAMGFCLFNNVAVSARAAQAEHGVERVLIIDWDVHHGNGTQDAFYDDPRVFFLSLHLDGHYPGTGGAHETGVGAGVGTTVNVPLPAGLPAADYRRTFSEVVGTVFRQHAPELVLVSAGYDCLAGDPLGGLLLEPSDLYDMTAEVMDLCRLHGARGPVLVLEGGYAPKRVGQAVAASLRALAGADY